MMRCLSLFCMTAAWAAEAGECWQPVVEPNRVQFIATQTGADFPGSFGSYEGTICLDPDNPGAARIEISIATASVDTGLPEFDDALRGADFFDSAQWPAATFRSSAVESPAPGKYVAHGTFTLKGTSRDISVPFAMDTSDTGPVLQGETEINRLDYKIGMGEWQDTKWVGNAVTLKFSVRLSK